MVFIRFAILLLTGLAILIATVPILVMINLLDGGTGWGLCPGGISACDNPYTTVAEFAVLLTLGFLACIWGIRILARLARRLQSDEFQVTQ